MKFTLYYPCNTREAASSHLVEDTHILEAHIAQRVPTFAHEDISSSVWRLAHGPHFKVAVVYPKATRAEVRLRLRISYCPRHRSKTWGYDAHISIPRDPETPAYLTKARKTGSPSSGTRADFQAQLDTMAQGLTLLFAGGPKEVLIEEGVRSPERLTEILDTLATLLQRERRLEKDQIANRKEEISLRAKELSLLPDGTAIAIRAGATSRAWQLGIKRGNVSKALARNCCLATPKDLEGDDLAEAGLSRHRVLILSSQAKAAIEEFPHLTEYPHDTSRRTRKSNLSLDKEKPFHESMISRETIKERRRDMQVVWIQTGFPFRYPDHYINDDPEKILLSTSAMGHPNFPSADQAPLRVYSLTRLSAAQDDATIRDFERVCGVITISERAAEVIRGHDIGKTTLKPMMVVDTDDRLIETRYVPVLQEDRPSILISLMPQILQNSLNNRAVKNFEIPIDASQHDTLDLWIDSRLRDTPLLLSGRLVAALKKAGLDVPPALKRVDIR